MTQSSSPWDGLLVGDAADAPYSATEWASYWNLTHGVGSRFPNYGVLKGSGSGNFQPLEVHATTPATTNVTVEIGAALVNGRLYRSTAAEAMTVQPNASGNDRIDTVIVRADFTAQTIRLVVKQGTPAASPVRPTLQQDASVWEIPLADIDVANGFATITAANITPRQRYVQFPAMGWQPYAYPLTWIGGSSYASNNESLAANGGTIAIPFAVTGNLLLIQARFWINSTSIAYNLAYDVYAQDNMDIDSTPDGTLRRIATSDANIGTLPGAAAALSIQGTVPTLLTPGLYWLALQNRHATNAINLGAINQGSLTVAGNTAQKKTTANPNGATLDFATGWVGTNQVIDARMRGTAFGLSTTVF